MLKISFATRITTARSFVLYVCHMSNYILNGSKLFRNNRGKYCNVNPRALCVFYKSVSVRKVFVHNFVQLMWLVYLLHNNIVNVPDN